jgi:hypothetical protein
VITCRISNFEFRNPDFENSTQLMINPTSDIRLPKSQRYVYCVAERVSNFPSQVVGIAEQEIELVTVDGLVVVTSKFESDVVPLTRENVLRHETVVRSVFATTTPLPFRFGTLVTQQVLNSYVKARRPALIERLLTVQNCAELSVKIIWSNSSEGRQSRLQPKSLPDESGPGSSFLKSKREELFGNQELGEEAKEISEWLGARLGRLVRQEKVTVEPRQKLVLSGSYLVRRDCETDFRSELEALRTERPELHFLISGPWPPYTFANIDLEFESQFGVS